MCKPYAKCPKCERYSVHLFNGKNLAVVGDALDANDNPSQHDGMVSPLNDFWVHMCADCFFIVAAGVEEYSLVNGESNISLETAIKNDAMEQALIDLENLYPNEVEAVLEKYGIKI
jgi:hypothetical protein